MYSNQFRFILPLAVIVLLAYLTIQYLNLGGSQDIQVNLVEGQAFVVYGKTYSGKYNSRQMEDLFFRIKNIALSEETAGEFCIVAYDTSGEGDSVSYFVGVITSNTNLLPNDLEPRAIEAGERLRTTLNMHNAVMPLPEDIRESMNVYADSLEVELEAYSIEKYVDDRTLVIDRPLKKVGS